MTQARAFGWQDGVMFDLGDFPEGSTALQANAINKKSQIVGGSTSIAGVSRAFLWHEGTVVDLGSLAGSGGSTYAWSINDHGSIVGAGLNASGELRAIRWADGAPAELGVADDGRVATQAFGINDRGAIVGYLSPGATAAFAHAFLWQDGAFTDLGTLPETDLSFATAINDRGQVVGQSFNTSIPGAARAFLWDEGALQDLGFAAPDHTYSEARAIDKRGTVVGGSGIGLASTAWAWSEGTISDLNSLIVEDDPSRPYVHLTIATGISDRGAILAQGYDQRMGEAIRGYLLVPDAKGNGKLDSLLRSLFED